MEIGDYGDDIPRINMLQLSIALLQFYNKSVGVCKFMDSIVITLHDHLGRKHDLELPENVSLKAIIPVLLDRLDLGIPNQSADQYTFRFGDTTLALDSSLCDAGIVDGNILSLVKLSSE